MKQEGRTNGTQTRLLGGESKAERQAIRMEIAAEKLLEGPLRRTRWLAADRDRIAAFLRDLVDEEVQREKGA